MCGNLFAIGDMNYKHSPYISCECKYCSHERYFTNIAIASILRIYDLRYGQYSDELLEIEIIRAKIRFILRGGETKYITFKQTDMITSVNNSTEMRQALNENLHALLTKKRKLPMAKEVNNTLGKMLIDVKMEIMNNAMTGNREGITWFANNANQQPQLESSEVHIPRINYKQAK